MNKKVKTVIVLALASLMGIGAGLVASESRATTLMLMRRQAIEENGTLPRRITDKITLTKVSVDAEGKISEYTVAREAIAQCREPQMFLKRIEPVLTSTACKMLRTQLNKSISYKYRYLDADGVLIGDVVVSKASCQQEASDE